MPSEPQSISSGQEVDWLWQRARIETLLADAEGTTFEEFFQKIASLRWPGTFSPSIPMGSRGDLKCDGYESTARAVFQCYAPRGRTLKVDATVKKIDADFRGARDHWTDKMRVWRFVHNTPRDALPAEVIQALVALADELGIPYETWGRPLVLETARQIAPHFRSDHWGRAPQTQDVRQRVTFEGIGRVLAYLKQSQATSDLSPIQLPAGFDEKCAFNGFSVAVQVFLRLGLQSENRVGDYLKRQVEPREADNVAEAFKNRYLTLRTQGAAADDILTQMIIYAGGITGNLDHDLCRTFRRCLFFCDLRHL